MPTAVQSYEELEAVCQQFQVAIQCAEEDAGASLTRLIREYPGLAISNGHTLRASLSSQTPTASRLLWELWPSIAPPPYLEYFQRHPITSLIHRAVNLDDPTLQPLTVEEQRSVVRYLEEHSDSLDKANVAHSMLPLFHAHTLAPVLAASDSPVEKTRNRAVDLPVCEEDAICIMVESKESVAHRSDQELEELFWWNCGCLELLVAYRPQYALERGLINAACRNGALGQTALVLGSEFWPDLLAVLDRENPHQKSTYQLLERRMQPSTIDWSAWKSHTSDRPPFSGYSVMDSGEPRESYRDMQRKRWRMMKDWSVHPIDQVAVLDGLKYVQIQGRAVFYDGRVPSEELVMEKEADTVVVRGDEVYHATLTDWDERVLDWRAYLRVRESMVEED